MEKYVHGAGEAAIRERETHGDRQTTIVAINDCSTRLACRTRAALLSVLH